MHVNCTCICTNHSGHESDAYLYVVLTDLQLPCVREVHQQLYSVGVDIVQSNLTLPLLCQITCEGEIRLFLSNFNILETFFSLFLCPLRLSDCSHIA